MDFSIFAKQARSYGANIVRSIVLPFVALASLAQGETNDRTILHIAGKSEGSGIRHRL